MDWFYYALLCSVLISISTLFQKKILFQEHAIEFCFVIALYNAVLTSPLLVTAWYAGLSLPKLAVIALSGALSATSFLLSSKAVRHMEVSVSSPMFATVPVITAIFAFIVLGEKLTLVQSIGVLLVGIGCYLLQVVPGRSSRAVLKDMFGSKYIHLLLLASCLYAITSVIDRVVVARWGIAPGVYVPLLHVSILFTTVVIIKLFYTDITIIPRGFDNHGLAIFVVAALTMGYRFAQMHALTTGYTGKVVAVKYSSVLFTTVVGIELYREGGLKRKIFASFVILIGVFSVVFKI